jgi:hypothetical protein
MAIADSPAGALRSGPRAAPAVPPLPPRIHVAIGPPANTSASVCRGGRLAREVAGRVHEVHIEAAIDRGPAFGEGGAPLARGAGFAIHQLLAAMPELRAPPAELRQTIGAYRAHLASRIHYSGPVRPVDLRV